MRCAVKVRSVAKANAGLLPRARVFGSAKYGTGAANAEQEQCFSSVGIPPEQGPAATWTPAGLNKILL